MEPVSVVITVVRLKEKILLTGKSQRMFYAKSEKMRKPSVRRPPWGYQDDFRRLRVEKFPYYQI
jgi:hypothetical protein